jgi:beta-carotene 3-hydroxylase
MLSTDALLNASIVLATVVGMEAVARYSHEYVMHGWGWNWHRSHHENEGGTFERNDLYAVVFSVLSIILIYFGTYHDLWFLWVGVGMTVYGALYFLVHDALVHNRWSIKIMPRGRYLKRLVQAHRLHHAVRTKEGCVSFGFLYAAPVDTLKAELRALHGGRFGASEARGEASIANRD